MTKLGPVLGDAWRLFSAYFLHSKERAQALLILLLLLALNLAQVGLGVAFTFWTAQEYNALQALDATAFWQLIFTYRVADGVIMPGFPVFAVALIVMGIYTVWVQQLLQIKWRAWLTSELMRDWLSDRAYYQVNLITDPLSPGVDNPDQRIADDVNRFTDDTLTLGTDFISNVVGFFSYVVLLYTLSGPITILGVTIPGYMLWVAILYSLAGTLLTHWVGRPLVLLRFQQQRLEANFRFNLVRIRENVEGIALSGGEAEEQAGLGARLNLVVLNFRALMNRLKILGVATSGFSELSLVFPAIVAAPRLLSGAIKLGTWQQISSVFGEVQNSLSWFINQYGSLAEWRATVGRLGTFQRTIAAIRAEDGGTVSASTQTGKDLSCSAVSLSLPNGRKLLDQASFRVRQGQASVITGRSGAGKSTLLRALAGLCPFAGGEVQRPAGRVMFLPQQPYVPLGTLRQALCYPQPVDAVSDQGLTQVLADVGLVALAPRLDDDESWARQLSPGEQQRVALARALLVRPDWLFLDEATASLDQAAEAALYALLRQRLPNTTLVSVAHRDSLIALHDHRIDFDGAGHLLEAAE